jgi:hypothetical protein
MAQADQTVQNATFPTVRADINNNLAALFSANSGSIEPRVSTPGHPPAVAYMDWIDTGQSIEPSSTLPVWRKRNAANNGWVKLGTITGSAIAFEGTLPSQTGNAGEYLTTDGTVASWASITAAGQLLRAPQVLTSGTTYTTPANCTSIYVEAIGGGGGGGSTSAAGGGGGGGAGGYCAKYFTVVAAVSYTYAIGAGGAAANAGGSTTFTVGGTTITAGGGARGLTESHGGAGGTCTNGDMNIAGGGGGSGSFSAPGGAGGNSFFGGGAPGQGGTNNGVAGTSGGGGSGGSSSSTTRPGGAGGAGLIRIWEFS